MTRHEALTALLAKVEAEAEGVSLDAEFWVNLGIAFSRASRHSRNVVEAYHGSLDAAKALHEAVLPEWCWSVDRMGQAQVWFPWEEGDAPSFEAGENGSLWDNPARAWLIAILKALIAMEGDQ